MTIFRPPVTTLFSALTTTIDSPFRRRFAIWLAARPRMRSLASTTVALRRGAPFAGAGAADFEVMLTLEEEGAGLAAEDPLDAGFAVAFVIFGARGAFLSAAAGAGAVGPGSGKEPNPRSVRFRFQQFRDRERRAARRVDLRPRVLGVVE